MTAYDALLMRGGTSRAPFLRGDQLPAEREALAPILARVMGSGSPLQVDGIGGGQPTTSKIAVLSRSERDDADVDYLFGQVDVERAHVDFQPTCGNILSAVGPAALEMGLARFAGEETTVRVHAVNTGALVDARVRTSGGEVFYEGEQAIAGVPGTAAPVWLSFRGVAGSKTGALFPTGHRREHIDGLEVSCIDAAMPMIVMRAADLGVEGTEGRDALDANRALFERFEPVRVEAGRRMGLGDVSGSVVPKVGLIAPPRDGGTVTGRYFMPWSAHPSFAVSGAICVATCVAASGTVAEGVASRDGDAPVTIEHETGTIEVRLDGSEGPDGFDLRSAGIVRTARKIAAMKVFA